MPDTPAVAARGPIPRPAPLRQAVYDTLTELIITGSLKPGQHLVEADLAEHLGVSRQPIREALQRLHTAGWVDLRPAQGAFVHSPTAEECSQLLSVRAILETHSARGAAEHATPADVARLWELQRTGLTALAAGDARAIVEANAALHSHITHLSRNAVLAELDPPGGPARPLVRHAHRQAPRHGRLERARPDHRGHRRRRLRPRGAAHAPDTANTTDFYCEQIAAMTDRSG